MSWTNSYKENHKKWDLLVEELFPDAVLIKWGLNQRVYQKEKKIYKIRLCGGSDRGGLEFEYETNKKCEGVLWNLEPQYKLVAGKCEYLALKQMTGHTLDIHIAKGNSQVLKLHLLIKSLFFLSCKGIAYKQLRGRHTYIDSRRRPVFIDFGNSRRTNFFDALITNLFPFSNENGKWQVSRFGYIFSTVVRQKLFKKNNSPKNVGLVKNRPHESLQDSVLLAQHKKNLSDLNDGNIRGEIAQMGSFRVWKKSITAWFKEYPNRSKDLLRWEFDEGARVWGGESWAVIWDEIRRKIELRGKNIIECGFSMGLAAVHARMDGAKSIVSYQADELSLEVGVNAQKFFILDNIYYKYLNDVSALPGNDQIVGFALSIHENKKNWIKIEEKLRPCATIVKRTENGIEIIKNIK